MNTAEGIEVPLTGLAGLVGFEAWAILLLFVSAGLAFASGGGALRRR
jgi:hypothetical protein